MALLLKALFVCRFCIGSLDLTMIPNHIASLTDSSELATPKMTSSTTKDQKDILANSPNGNDLSTDVQFRMCNTFVSPVVGGWGSTDVTVPTTGFMYECSEIHLLPRSRSGPALLVTTVNDDDTNTAPQQQQRQYTHCKTPVTQPDNIAGDNLNHHTPKTTTLRTPPIITQQHQHQRLMMSEGGNNDGDLNVVNKVKGCSSQDDDGRISVLDLLEKFRPDLERLDLLPHTQNFFNRSSILEYLRPKVQSRGKLRLDLSRMFTLLQIFHSSENGSLAYLDSTMSKFSFTPSFKFSKSAIVDHRDIRGDYMSIVDLSFRIYESWRVVDFLEIYGGAAGNLDWMLVRKDWDYHGVITNESEKGAEKRIWNLLMAVKMQADIHLVPSSSGGRGGGVYGDNKGGLEFISVPDSRVRRGSAVERSRVAVTKGEKKRNYDMIWVCEHPFATEVLKEYDVWCEDHNVIRIRRKN